MSVKLQKKEKFDLKGYIKSLNAKEVVAIHVTDDGLGSGFFAFKDVRFDEDVNGYVVDTFIMNNIDTSFNTCTRRPAMVATSPVRGGDWIVSFPKVWPNDHETNIVMSNTDFVTHYDPTDNPSLFKLKPAKKEEVA